MFKSRMLITIAILFFVSPQVFCSVYEGKISKILSGPGFIGRVYVAVDGDPGQSGCHNNSNYNYIFDSSTDAGKTTLSMLLSAYATQSTVRLVGAGSDPNDCSLDQNVEDLQQLLLK